jgi:hypothetical protein
MDAAKFSYYIIGIYIPESSYIVYDKSMSYGWIFVGGICDFQRII